MTKNLKLFKAHYYLRAPVFWIPIIVDYFGRFSINESSVFALISWYSLIVVISEFPTGVVGDKYSHKLSVATGLVLGIISILVFLFNLPLPIYFAVMTIFGISVSLISGSDIALLHSITNDFDKSYKQIQSTSGIISILGILSGGFLYVINPRLPFILTLLLFIFALGCLLAIRPRHKKSSKETPSSNIYSLINKIKSQVLTNSQIQKILILIGISSGFFYSYKWFFNPLFEVWDIPLAWYGVLTSLTFISKIIGIKISSHIKVSPGILLVISGGLVATTALLSNSIIAIISMMLSFVAWGILDTELVINLNKLAPNSQELPSIHFHLCV